MLFITSSFIFWFPVAPLPCRVHCRRCGDIVSVYISLYGDVLSSVCIIYALHLYLNIVPDSIQYLFSIVPVPAGLFGL